MLLDNEKKQLKNTKEPHQSLLTFNRIILKTGVFLSSLCLIIGAISYLIQFGSQPFSSNTALLKSHSFTSLRDIFINLKNFNFVFLIDLGIFFLIFTPFLRVFFSIFLFFKIKDKMYGFISFIVFLILLVIFFEGVF